MRCEICGKDMLYETLGTSKELDYYTQSKGTAQSCTVPEKYYTSFSPSCIPAASSKVTGVAGILILR